MARCCTAWAASSSAWAPALWASAATRWRSASAAAVWARAVAAARRPPPWRGRRPGRARAGRPVRPRGPVLAGHLGAAGLQVGDALAGAGQGGADRLVRQPGDLQGLAVAHAPRASRREGSSPPRPPRRCAAPGWRRACRRRGSAGRPGSARPPWRSAGPRDRRRRSARSARWRRTATASSISVWQAASSGVIAQADASRPAACRAADGPATAAADQSEKNPPAPRLRIMTAP